MAAPRSDCGRSPSLARPGGGRLVSARTPVAEGRLGPIKPVTTFQSANKFSETDHRRLRVSSHEIRISLRENAPCAPGSSPGRGESSAVRGGWAGRTSGTRPRHPRTAIRTRPPVTDRPASSCRDDPLAAGRGACRAGALLSHRLPRSPDRDIAATGRSGARRFGPSHSDLCPIMGRPRVVGRVCAAGQDTVPSGAPCIGPFHGGRSWETRKSSG